MLITPLAKLEVARTPRRSAFNLNVYTFDVNIECVHKTGVGAGWVMGWGRGGGRGGGGVGWVTGWGRGGGRGGCIFVDPVRP